MRDVFVIFSSLDLSLSEIRIGLAAHCSRYVNFDLKLINKLNQHIEYKYHELRISQESHDTLSID
jgi:hypothetical protein